MRELRMLRKFRPNIIRRQISIGRDRQHASVLPFPDPPNMQIVNLRLFQDLAELIDSEHEAGPKSGVKTKVIQQGDDQALVIVLAEDGSLEVKVYPNTVLVWGSQLRLMAPITQLH